MRQRELVDILQRRAAIAAIGPSALRGQGAPGVIRAARNHCANMDLAQFSTKQPGRFARRLDEQTEMMMRSFPAAARSFGGARKALNLFLRDAVYTAHLREFYGLDVCEQWCEIPIDSVVAKGLRALDSGNGLPRWRGLKRLTPDENREYQRFAEEYAGELGVARVHLDAWLWVSNR